MSFFSLPLHQWQQQESILTSRRRKSTSDEAELDFPGSEGYLSSSQGGFARARTVTSSVSQEYPSFSDSSQRRFAGLDPDDPLPRPPFPHAPVSYGKTNRRKYVNPAEELQYLNPPLYLPESLAKNGSLRMQHFSVLSTILHRCLLEGD